MDSLEPGPLWRRLRDQEERSIIARQLRDASPTMVLAGIFTSVAAAIGMGLLLQHVPAVRPVLGRWVIIGVLVTSVIAACWLAYWRHKKTIRELGFSPADQPARLRHQISRVNSAMTEAAELMDNLQRDLAAQQAARETLIAEAEHQQRLLEVNKVEAEKIRLIIVGETKRSLRTQRFREWGFFLAGLALAVPINILSDLIGPK
ncbi:hypothetical protein [Nonomuraea maritima]|uniref:hypothetical protein n=1 Tax=Nonomuraea maritima TaxID=683260 RepID=UPI00371698B9